MGGAPAALRRDDTGDRELKGDTRGEDRAVEAGIMLTPSRLQAQSSIQSLTALTQNVISSFINK